MDVLSEKLFGGPGMSLRRGPAPSSAAAAAEHSDFPAKPALALFTHVVVKGIEVGACAGVLVAPLWALVRARPIGSVWKRALLGSTALATAASLALMAGVGAQGKLTPEGVDDRAFRLARNEAQAEVDRAALVGAAAGLAATTVIIGTGVAGALAGGLTGVALGMGARTLSGLVGGEAAAPEQEKAGAAAPAAAQIK